MAGSPKSDRPESRGQREHNSNPAALQDGRGQPKSWGQPKAGKTNMKEIRAEDECTGPKAQRDADKQRISVQRT